MKALPWLRLYTEIIDDEKLGLLAFEDRWHFIALLCLKGKGILDSEPDKEMLWRKVAFKMGLTVAELEKVVDRLSRMKLIDRETLQPQAWDARQAQSDSSTERTRKYREKKRAASEYRHGDEGETSQERPSDALEEDKEEEIEREETVVASSEIVGAHITDASPSAPAKRKEPTGTRLPANWALPKRWGEWALTERPDMTAEDVRREAACFADHWHSAAGARGRKADWEATWRNWIRRCNGPAPMARASPHGPAGHFVSKQEQIEQHNRAVAERVVQRMQAEEQGA